MVHPIWSTYPDIATGLVKVQQIMIDNLSVRHPEIREKIIAYIKAPGKYLRAGLCLWMAQLVEDDISDAKCYFAAYIEVLHLATLIHDDVIDAADSRRGLESFQVAHTNRIAIYAGDYLLAYAHRLLARGIEMMEPKQRDDLEIHHTKVMEYILNGELSQLLHHHNRQMTRRAYLRQIRHKTALLFGLATQLGSYYDDQAKHESKRSFKIGESIGMAFQVSDDLLDFSINNRSTGKPIMQDVQNGIYTLPIIHALSVDRRVDSLLQLKNRQLWTTEDLMMLHGWLVETDSFSSSESLIASYLDRVDNQLSQFTNRDTQFIVWLREIMKRQF